ncbi:hypothetical protein GQ600_23967 [Phytophthora cactorum]|nr:hypothetical protein GQ600_23967 [Phytophthora cactorum]
MVFGFDLTYSDLFCFRDSAWLNDDAMHGFAVFLARYKNNVTVQRVQPSSSTKIKLNGKVRRAGRPHLNCAAMKAKAALALIEYNNGMKLRALLRDNDVCDLVSTLWMIMPGVREVGSFLTTFPIKQKGGERPIQWRVDGITYRIESNSDYLNRLLTLRWIS